MRDLDAEGLLYRRLVEDGEVRAACLARVFVCMTWEHVAQMSALSAYLAGEVVPRAYATECLWSYKISF